MSDIIPGDKSVFCDGHNKPISADREHDLEHEKFSRADQDNPKMPWKHSFKILCACTSLRRPLSMSYNLKGAI